jgi:hypothetical protein
MLIEKAPDQRGVCYVSDDQQAFIYGAPMTLTQVVEHDDVVS